MRERVRDRETVCVSFLVCVPAPLFGFGEEAERKNGDDLCCGGTRLFFVCVFLFSHVFGALISVADREFRGSCQKRNQPQQHPQH